MYCPHVITDQILIACKKKRKSAPREKQPWASSLVSVFLPVLKALRVRKHSYWFCSHPLPINTISMTASRDSTASRVMEEVRTVSPRSLSPPEMTDCHVSISVPPMRPKLSERDYNSFDSHLHWYSSYEKWGVPCNLTLNAAGSSRTYLNIFRHHLLCKDLFSRRKR